VKVMVRCICGCSSRFLDALELKTNRPIQCRESGAHRNVSIGYRPFKTGGRAFHPNLSPDHSQDVAQAPWLSPRRLRGVGVTAIVYAAAQSAIRATEKHAKDGPSIVIEFWPRMRIFVLGRSDRSLLANAGAARIRCGARP